jgi:hypothetical protein
MSNSDGYLHGRPSLLQLLLGCGMLLLGNEVYASEPQYSSDVTQWVEVVEPPDGADRAAWYFAADYAQLAWRVFLGEDNRPSARLVASANAVSSDQAPFDARADGFRGANRFWKVGDGWLVGFNHGEFGAALYWFDRQGRQHHKISDDHVVEFFARPDGTYAIEGMAHMGASCGSLIRITQPAAGRHWEAQRIVRLPYAPTTLVTRRDGTMLIALSDSLVSVGPDFQVTTLISHVPWQSLYPASSILTPDERYLYLGMRQFVGEIDLDTNTLRLLVPSNDFINRLPADQDERIRKQYAKGMGDWRPPADLCERMEKARREIHPER